MKPAVVLTPHRLPAILAISGLSLSVVTAADAAPTGVIAGVQHGHGVVYSLGSKAVKQLPMSDHTAAISLSPDGKRAVYFVPVTYKKGDVLENGPFSGYRSVAPFATATALPASMTGNNALQMTWTSNSTVAVNGYETHGYYSATASSYTKSATPLESASEDGKWVTYSTTKDIIVCRSSGTDARTLFHIGSPDSLIAAVKQAAIGGNVKDITDEIDPDLYHEAQNWAIGNPIITKDGKAVYFACNAGTSQGAQGNTTLCFVRADVASGKLTVMGKLGTIFGRTPSDFALSPDGTRLLVSSSAHDSAVNNSYVVYDIDIATGKRVDLLAADPDAKTDANLVQGVCWSPDGDYAAVAVTYYDPQKITDSNDFNPVMNLEIKAAATGKTVLTVKDFASPCWR